MIQIAGPELFINELVPSWSRRMRWSRTGSPLLWHAMLVGGALCDSLRSRGASACHVGERSSVAQAMLEGKLNCTDLVQAYMQACPTSWHISLLC